HLPARLAVPDYFARFEQRFRVPIQRPVRVIRVEDDPAADGAERPLLVHSIGPDGSRRAPLRTRAVLNATGTWTRPFVPAHPGDCARAAAFTGARVGIIGGGISALDPLLEIAEVGQTFWYTRREPVFRDEPFTHELGRDAVAGVAERVRHGLPVRSVVSATGLVLTPELRRAQRRGLLARRPMFTAITPQGVREEDGQ